MSDVETTATAPKRGPEYWNPYLAGVGLGLTLLLSFVVLGTGLGAYGAITRIAAASAHGVLPGAVEKIDRDGEWFGAASPLADYLVFMTLGTLIGGGASAFVAGRVRPMIERGAGALGSRRLLFALIGGLLVGGASRLARGCTSGQALSGGAVFSAGSWAFMGAVFVGAFAFAPIIKKEWLR